MANQKIIIAIDGYSACGKSTTAKEVAKHLNYKYIDTGAMYRTVTYYFLENYVNFELDKEVEQALSKIEIDFKPDKEKGLNDVYLNGVNVEKEIRTMRVSKKVSEVSAIKQVRTQLVRLQQQMGKKKGVVLDGRDIGTTVFPSAELKLFMTADMEIRAHRRQKELLAKANMVALDEIIENIKHRDHIDTHREESPLEKAGDAILIETTNVSIDEQVQYVLKLTDERIRKMKK